MGTREVYDLEQQKWAPYVSDPDKWYQHLLDMRDGLVEPDYLRRYIVGSGEKHRRLKTNRKSKTCGQFGVIRRPGKGDG